MQTKSKRRVTIFFLVTGTLLLVAASLYLVYSHLRFADREAKTARLEQSLQSGERIPIEEWDVKKKGERRVDEAEKGDKTSAPSSPGVVRIDKIDVLLPIFNDTSERSLRDGAGLLEDFDAPSSKTNSIAVLAGHRGGYNGEESFLHVDQLEEGDEIKVTTAGEVLYYRVYEQEVIEATDWSKFVAEEDKSKLFLLSCHPYPINDKRLLVKAELVKYYKNKNE